MARITFDNGMTRLTPENGKPRVAFADRSWVDPKIPGKLGPIRWDGLAEGSIAVHAGVERESKQGFAITPVTTGTTVSASDCDELAGRFANASVAGRKGLIYARLGHQSGFEVECEGVGLHNGGDVVTCGDAMVFGSGMAGISHTALTLLTAGDNAVVHKTLYGSSDDLFREVLPNLGMEVRVVDLTDPRVLRNAIDSRTRMVFFETPANPTLDLISIADVAKEVDGRCPVVVDNTFASPFGQNPFDFGAHIVLYSMTKSMGGHTNAIGGMVLGSGPFIEHMFLTRKDIGGIMTSREADAFLTGLKTFKLRYFKMQESARILAEVIREHGAVERVLYPLFDPRYPLGGQMKGPGHVISIVLKGGIEAGKELVRSLRMVMHAVSLGGVETLICHPASTTHVCIPAEIRAQKGIQDGLLRVSVGIEEIHDIARDFISALDRLKK